MRKSKHVIVERLEFIDVRDLKKAGALDGSWCEVPRVSLRYPFLDRLEVARYRVSMTMKNCAVAHAFRVEWMRCKLGERGPGSDASGATSDFGRLYCGGMFIGCRHCYGPAVYESQRRGDKGRKHQQASRFVSRSAARQPSPSPSPTAPIECGGRPLRGSKSGRSDTSASFGGRGLKGRRPIIRGSAFSEAEKGADAPKCRVCKGLGCAAFSHSRLCDRRGIVNPPIAHARGRR